MRKALVMEDDMPRRRSRSRRVEVDVDVERNLFMRLLLHSPKDTLAGFVALGAIIAIVANAIFMQAGRHPAPMFNTVFPLANGGTAAPTSAPGSVSPSVLPRPRPTNSETRPDMRSSEFRAAELRACDSQTRSGSSPRIRIRGDASSGFDSVGA